MKKLLHFLLVSTLFTGSCLLGACGKTGPLYLPDATPRQFDQQDK